MARDPRPQVPDLDPEPPELDTVQTRTWANDAVQVRRNLSALYGLPESFFLCRRSSKQLMTMSSSHSRPTGLVSVGFG